MCVQATGMLSLHYRATSLPSHLLVYSSTHLLTQSQCFLLFLPPPFPHCTVLRAWSTFCILRFAFVRISPIPTPRAG